MADGNSAFAGEVKREQFAHQRGFNLQLSGASISNITAGNNTQFRSSPVRDFTDYLTWIKGSHTITVGSQYKRIAYNHTLTNFFVPAVYLRARVGNRYGCIQRVQHNDAPESDRGLADRSQKPLCRADRRNFAG